MKDELERNLHSLTNESRNLSFDYKFAKDEAAKRDAILCEKLNDLEHTLLRERDEYRALVAQNNELNSAYEENLRDKENKIRMIRDIREAEVELEQKIRTTYEIFSEKDSQDVLENVNNLQRNRRECIDDLRAMALRIEDTINLIGNLSDTTTIDDTTNVFKNKLHELEVECQSKDTRIKEWNKENFNVNLEVDQTRRVRGDFEGENKNLVDLKGSYDNVLVDHSRLKTE